MRVLCTFLYASIGCGSISDAAAPEPTPAPTHEETHGAVVDEAELAQQAVERPASCDAAVPIFAAGIARGEVCPVDAAPRGLTLVDLSDDWTPFVLSEERRLGEVGRQRYHDVFVALADERLEDVPPEFPRERYLELFGIPPTLRVLLGRLEDEARHRCHAEVDTAPLAQADPSRRVKLPDDGTQLARALRAKRLGAFLDAKAEERGVSPRELADDDRFGHHVTRLRHDEELVRAIEVVQRRLVCDQLLEEPTWGAMDEESADALARWQRLQMIVGGRELDPTTRSVLLRSGEENDFRALLRALRERVVSATGLIEDGSAAHAWRDVLGRNLDDPRMRFPAGHPPAEGGAPDRIGAATEAAATALGWTSPADARDGLRALRDAGHEVVALRLPSAPRYHADHMPLRAVVDRGDVVYDFPYSETGRARRRPVERRPIVTLYSGRVALMRWPTTIGGWQREAGAQGVGLKYKESPPGPAVWRDVIAGPTWLPPMSTPTGELMRYAGRGTFQPRTELFGPGYRSAYGLAMMVHHSVRLGEDGEVVLEDNGIRMHGSASYASITRGSSHGCHRLHNHLALRLSSFVLRHRRHVRKGRLGVLYRREVTIRGEPHELRIDDRGHLFELTPPVPVEVHEGRIRGRTARAVRGIHPGPAELRAAAEGEADPAG